MKIYHGNIISCDQQNRTWKYLIEKGGRIHYLGDTLPKEYQSTPRIELEKKALLPSFADGHIHFSNWALLAASQFDVREAKDISSVQQVISDFVSTAGKRKVIVGFGISLHKMKEKRLILRKELDNACPKIPLVLIGYDGHTSICNSSMMELFPSEFHQLRGYNQDSGQMYNEAYYQCTDYATGLIPPIQLVQSLIKAYDMLAEKGIGMIHTVEGIGFPGDLDVGMVSLAAKAMARRKGFQTRVYFQTMRLEKVKKRKLPRVGGCFATAIDGCFGACDAALLEPYSHQPDQKGILFHKEEELEEFVREAHKEGLQISLHAIGDAAVRRAVNAFEKAITEHPRGDHRHRLIHASLIHPEDLERIESLKLGITLQPAFLSSPLEPVEYLEKILGPRIRKGSPLKSFLDRNIPLSGGSDGPVTYPDPYDGLAACLAHPYNESQSLSIEEALPMFTREVYRTSFDDENRGTLEAGKWADMVILEKNPLEITSPEEMRNLKVESLLLKGKPYKKGMSVPGMLLSGLFGPRVKI